MSPAKPATIVVVRGALGVDYTISLGRVRSGGQAQVYAATGPHGERVALKVALLPLPAGAWLHDERDVLIGLAADPRAAPHVARVRDSGMWGDRPFVVLDWYPQTLETALVGAPIAKRLALVRLAVDAVAAVGEGRGGLVHRDLKPSNLLIDDEGAVRVADFGTARSPGWAATSGLTVGFGTAGFAAPEQALPSRLRPDRSWDVYALAATVFFGIVGRPAVGPAQNPACLTPDGLRLLAGHPVPEGDVGRLLAFDRMNTLVAEDRRALAAVVTGPLAAALEAALEPRPDRRRGSIAAIREALAATVARPPPRRWSWTAATGLLATGAVAAALALPARTTPYPMVALDGFEIGRTEVTQRLWREVTGEDASQRRTFLSGGVGDPCASFRGVSTAGDDLPVTCVDWLDAVTFANQLSARDGFVPAYRIAVSADGAPEVEWDAAADGYRLPTEAEWEYAARAGEEGEYPGGSWEGICAHANVMDTTLEALRPKDWAPLAFRTCHDGHPGLSPVGAFPANALGIFDMIGNAAEWVWGVGPEPAPALRGGSFSGDPEVSRFAWSSGMDPRNRSVAWGFRLARSGG